MREIEIEDRYYIRVRGKVVGFVHGEELQRVWESMEADISDMRARLKGIATIIEDVDNRCAAVDGPVTPTLKEMTQKELSAIYKIAKQRL